MPCSNPAVGASCRRPKSCRRCFIYFGRLPPELRHIIWEHALQVHTPGRFVVFDRYAQRIIPTAGLVAPLLRVDRESRHVALRHYTLRIPVHDISQLTRSQPFGPGIVGERGFYVSEVGAKRGCLYLNPTRDPFVVDIQFADFQGPDMYIMDKPYYRYTTKQIEPDNCNLSPPCVVRVGGFWSRSYHVYGKKDECFFQRHQLKINLALQQRRGYSLITPGEFIEYLTMWDVDRLKELDVCVHGRRGIDRRLLKIRKQAVTQNGKTPPRSGKQKNS